MWLTALIGRGDPFPASVDVLVAGGTVSVTATGVRLDGWKLGVVLIVK